MNRGLRIAATVGLLLLLAACARQVPEAVEYTAATPGFWWGLWHGFVFPFAWIGSLFDPDDRGLRGAQHRRVVRFRLLPRRLRARRRLAFQLEEAARECIPSLISAR